MKLLKVILVIWLLAASSVFADLNLWIHEGKGHTIRKHVGKSRIYLLQRMRPKEFLIIGAAPMIRTSFNDYQEASNYIEQVLDVNISTIHRWLSSDEPRLAVKSSFGHTGTGSIGLVAYRREWLSGNGPTPIYWGKGDGVMVVLIKDSSMPSGYFILTAYPTFSLSPVPVDLQTQNQ